jgi:hypothetical protein
LNKGKFTELKRQLVLKQVASVGCMRQRQRQLRAIVKHAPNVKCLGDPDPSGAVAFLDGDNGGPF